jgi:transcriptional regulator of acetoin/glycerol metabolism
MFDIATKQQIADQWSRFCTNGEADPGVVRDFIMASWQRSRNHNVDPLKVKQFKVSESRLEAILEDHKLLVRISLPVIENLYDFIKGSRSIIILADENGIILSRTGDPEYLNDSEAYEPGIEYSERIVGTNGIGTSLSLDRAVQIWAEEHFAEQHHEISCSAAPIHDIDGRVIGCLNLSCMWDRVNTHTLGMVQAAANSIEQQMRVESVLENKVALLQEKEGIFELIHDGLLTMDRNLVITDINEQARRMLGIDSGLGAGSMVGEYILSGIDFRKIIADSRSVYDRDVTLQLTGGMLCCTLSATPIAKSAGLVITLREAKSVRRMVNRYAGAKAVFTFDDIIGESPQIRESIRFARIAGKSSTNTLILGESGTGKEMFAQAIHNDSERSNGPFVAINCGALPRELIQSELFGYADGAFTGARRRGNPGKFELADGGTIFLDEIGEMPLSAQVNLLRVVESKEVVRVGDTYARPIDVRVIAATNSRLMQAITENTFREELYYRLNVLTINLPPLRLRTGDVQLLVSHFLKKVCRVMGRTLPGVDNDVQKALLGYRWPGNIRELENTLERAVHICRGDLITMEDLSRDVTSLFDPDPAVSAAVRRADRENSHISGGPAQLLKQREYSSIVDVLGENGGNIRRSAEMLGIARSTLYEKIRRFGINMDELR